MDLFHEIKKKKKIPDERREIRLLSHLFFLPPSLAKKPKKHDSTGFIASDFVLRVRKQKAAASLNSHLLLVCTEPEACRIHHAHAPRTEFTRRRLIMQRVIIVLNGLIN